MDFEVYLLNIEATIFQTLEKIEKNKKGFIIVIDSLGRVVGTLTDGDIRRSLIGGYSLSSRIELIINSDFSYLEKRDTFHDIIKHFKSTKIDFLPILNEDKTLMNILTKKQFHVALLTGVNINFNNDFSLLDDIIIDHEIYDRPWGYYKTVYLSDFSRAKIICVNPGEELSLQEHKLREEHWVIIKGIGTIQIAESIKEVSEGDYIFIPKGCKHKVSNHSTFPLMISEVQLGSYFGEDDIIRYEDKYGRVVSHDR